MPGILQSMMTSSNGNIFRVTGHLCEEFTAPRWIPLTKGQCRRALMFFLICAWTNGWVNTEGDCDLRRHRADYEQAMVSTINNRYNVVQISRYHRKHVNSEFENLKSAEMNKTIVLGWWINFFKARTFDQWYYVYYHKPTLTICVQWRTSETPVGLLY